MRLNDFGSTDWFLSHFSRLIIVTWQDHDSFKRKKRKKSSTLYRLNISIARSTAGPPFSPPQGPKEVGYMEEDEKRKSSLQLDSVTRMMITVSRALPTPIKHDSLTAWDTYGSSSTTGEEKDDDEGAKG